MTSLSRVFGSFVVLSALSSVACSAEVTSVPPREEPAAPPSIEPSAPTEEPPGEASRPAKLRVAHMWEQVNAVEVCILGEGDGGVGIRPMYRTQGAARERTEGGVPRHKVGKYLRLEAGPRFVKIIGADALDCSAPEIASAQIPMVENAAYTLALFGSDPDHVSVQVLLDERAPEAGVESIRFYDFVNDTSASRSASFEGVARLENYRATPSDTLLAPQQEGRIAVVAGGEQINVHHARRAPAGSPRSSPPARLPPTRSRSSSARTTSAARAR